MKRILSIIIVLVVLLSFAVIANAEKANEKAYALQEDFLKDMAAGITKRLNDNEDTNSMNTEQLAAYFLKVVGYELDKIEKYQDMAFEDNTFDQLAHLYIGACQLQRFAAQKYKNSDLFNSLWDSGRETRSVIIIELYTHYDLPITSDQAESYKSSDSGSSFTASMNGTLDISTGLTVYDDKMVTYKEVEIKQNRHQVLFDDQDVKITLKSLELKNNRYTVNMTISNSMKSNRVTCYLSGGYVDDYSVSLYHPYGYRFVDAGKKGDTYSDMDVKELEEIGKNPFKTLSCSLYVLTTDGGTGQYIARIPIKIAGFCFN